MLSVNAASADHCPVHCSDDIYNETAITVLNTNNQGAPDGPLENITGLGLLTDDPGKLLVYFPDIGYGDCECIPR